MFIRGKPLKKTCDKHWVAGAIWIFIKGIILIEIKTQRKLFINILLTIQKS